MQLLNRRINFLLPSISLHNSWLRTVTFVYLFIALFSFSQNLFSQSLILPDAVNFNTVRVLIVRSSNDIVITVDKPVYLSNNIKRIALIKNNNTITFKGAARSFQAVIQQKIFESSEFTIEAADSNETISFNKKEYPGKLVFQRVNSEILVINRVELEEYVKGVVVPELGKVDSLSLESVKSMAVCARTYAINKMKEIPIYFDLESTTQDQVYRGRSTNSIYNKLIDETKGQVLSFQSEVAVMFYSACCGGVTESIENVFKREPLPYLTSVRDGDPSYCAESPTYAWKEEYTEKEFLDLLIQAGFLQVRNHETIEKIESTETYPSGRTKVLTVSMSDGSSISIPSEQIRPVFRRKSNNGILRTSFIDASLIRNSDQKQVIIKGRGNGHGVGLCQWGSMGMAKKGLNYEQILEHYFPGTTILKVND